MSIMTKKEFKAIFDLYFDDIRKYVFYCCGDQETAGDVAQDVFLKIWEKRDIIDLNQVKGLLYTSATHLYKSIYRHEQVKFKYVNNFKNISFNSTPYDEIKYQEIAALLENAIKQMPESARVAFLMSRIDDLSYKEIAKQLDLSTKAVEKRMGVALSILRKTVTNYYMGTIKL